MALIYGTAQVHSQHRAGCSRSIPANGRCNNTVKNDCHDGTLRDTGDSRTHYRWECLGVGSGRTDECELRKSSTPATQRPTTPTSQRPTPPATQRPTPPATQRPTTPTSQRPTPPATRRPTPPATRRPTPPATQRPTTPATQRPTPPATQRPTTPATQRPTTQKIIGKCGSAANSCAAGISHSHPPDSSTHYLWTCRSIPHTQPNREVSCRVQKPTTPTTPATQRPTTQKIIGKCGSAANSCAAGISHSHPPDSSTHYLWTCRSIPHTQPNREVSCSKPK